MSRRLILSRMSAAYLKSILAVLLLVLLWAPTAPAQQLTEPLPLDPAVRTGRLANGLRYFIRRNERPADRAMLRLAVEAGSVDEADDQRGLAHVLEHMAFNGTTHFKTGELVKYLESIGARFGPHVNAYTSYDETVYMLDVPTDRPGVLERGFEALSDFAGGIALDEREIDRERGVVIEEWRGRQGAATRMQQPQIEALYGDSRYTNRLPIGTPEILKGFPAARLRDFYRDFYRPDRMAVIVVGDIDPAAIEKMVQEYFLAPPRRRAVRSHRLPRTAAPGDALCHRLRPGGAGQLRLAHPQASAPAVPDGGRLPARARASAGQPHDQRAFQRDRARARGAIPSRVSR